MNKAQIKQSLESGKLSLSIWEKSTHFEAVGFIFLFPAFAIILHLRDTLQGNPRAFRETEIWFIVATSLLALFVLILLNRGLKMVEIKHSLNRKQIDSILKKLSKELAWTTLKSNDEHFIAQTSPSSFIGKRGERITILFDEGKIWVNSISDPSKRGSVLFMARNKKHIERLKAEIGRSKKDARR